MPLVIPPGFAQATLNFTLTGDAEPMAVTFGVELVTPPGNQGHADAIRDAFVVASGPLDSLANDYTFTGVTLRVGQDGGPPVIIESSANTPGNAISEPMPQNCAVLIRKRSALAGREGQGRMYVPGLPENDVAANGVITSTTVTSTEQRWNVFRLEMEAGDPATDAPMVILHTSPQLGVLPPPTPVTNLICDPVIATQRRRLRR